MAWTVDGESCIPEPAPVWPALRPEAPAQMPRRSSRSTRFPASANRHAIDVPVMPPPTTITSGGHRAPGAAWIKILPPLDPLSIMDRPGAIYHARREILDSLNTVDRPR